MSSPTAEKTAKPFGHEITFRRLKKGAPNTFFEAHLETATLHRVGPASRARAAARAFLGFKEINITPISQDEWFRAYGVPGLRM